MSIEIRRSVEGVSRHILDYDKFVAVGRPTIDFKEYSRSWLWATNRVLRGSYWHSEPGNCRAAERFSENPDDRCFGFRAVRALGKTATGGDYAI